MRRPCGRSPGCPRCRGTRGSTAARRRTSGARTAGRSRPSPRRPAPVPDRRPASPRPARPRPPRPTARGRAGRARRPTSRGRAAFIEAAALSRSGTRRRSSIEVAVISGVELVLHLDVEHRGRGGERGREDQVPRRRPPGPCPRAGPASSRCSPPAPAYSTVQLDRLAQRDLPPAPWPAVWLDSVAERSGRA